MKKHLILTAFFLFTAFSIPTWAWQLNKDKSHIKFFIKSMLDNVNGKFHTFGVSNVKISDENMSGLISVNVKSIDTKNKKRDDHLRHEDFFFAERYPLAKIEISKVEKRGGKHMAHTAITIRGVTRKKVIPIKLQKTPGAITATGSVTLNRKKFGIKYGVFYNPISDTARVDFKINLVK